MRLRLFAVALAGCGFAPHGAPSDGSIDAPVATVDACVSATEQFTTCGLGSGSDLSITRASSYDTDTGLLVPLVGGAPVQLADTHVTTSPGVVADVLVVSSFELTANLTVRGSLPLAIVASGDVSISAELSVAVGGAGTRMTCDSPPVAGLVGDGGGGGGGGGFQGKGGAGEAGDSGTIAGGAGGGSFGSPGKLIGGCAGAPGGDGQTPATGGHGGLGGGVLLIATPGTISIAAGGGIDAGGQGGQPGITNKGGGGGGGSGGLIVLEAKTIANHGYVVANGGGGGEGAESSSPGWHGDDGHLDETRAAGGTGGSNGGTSGGTSGGDGGSGGAAGDPDGSDATDIENDGDGGGGGGVGFIGVRGDRSSSTGVFSPDVTPWP